MLPSDVAYTSPAHYWDESGFKSHLCIYLIHESAFCQLAWNVLFPETVSSYFCFQKLQSVCMTWKSYFQRFWLGSILASDVTTGIWAHSLALERAITAGHLSQEGYVSCSKYSTCSRVIFDTSLEIASWQRVTYGKPCPKHEQARFMCTIGLKREWGEMVGSEK